MCYFSIWNYYDYYIFPRFWHFLQQLGLDKNQGAAAARVFTTLAKFDLVTSHYLIGGETPPITTQNGKGDHIIIVGIGV
jgi:hypothetical protein